MLPGHLSAWVVGFGSQNLMVYQAKSHLVGKRCKSSSVMSSLLTSSNIIELINKIDNGVFSKQHVSLTTYWYLKTVLCSEFARNQPFTKDRNTYVNEVSLFKQQRGYMNWCYSQ